MPAVTGQKYLKKTLHQREVIGIINIVLGAQILIELHTKRQSREDYPRNSQQMSTLQQFTP